MMEIDAADLILLHALMHARELEIALSSTVDAPICRHNFGPCGRPSGARRPRACDAPVHVDRTDPPARQRELQELEFRLKGSAGLPEAERPGA